MTIFHFGVKYSFKDL